MTQTEALRLALEALEYYHSGEDYFPTPASKAITAIKAALEAKDEPTQKPVAWCSQCGHKCPQTVNQEPVGWWDAKIGFFEEKHFDQLCPLYTTPPAAQRTWVGLTLEEVQDSYNADYQAQTRAIEAKLKEKNR